MKTARLDALEQRRLLAAATTVVDFPNFGDATALELHGDAAVVDGRLRVSPDVRYSQGNAYTATPAPLGDDASFSARFAFEIDGVQGADGGDGLVFLVHSGDNGWLPPWGPGNTLGYHGVGASLAVEFDTARGGTDPDGNHVALHLWGNSEDPLELASVGLELTGGTRFAWVDYDGTTDAVRVFLNDADAKPAVPVVTGSVDLSAMLGGAFHAGFSAASGYDHSAHDVLAWTMTLGDDDAANDPPAPVDDGAIVRQNAGPTPLDVLRNDADPDGDPLTVLSAAGARHGTLTTDGARVFYEPDPGYAGPDSFTYRAGDGRGGLASADVAVTVEPTPASGTIGLEAGGYAVSESAGTVTIGVVREGGSEGVATVNFLTSDDTATAGGDYLGRSGTLRFADGQAYATITITLVDDARNEGDEDFAVSLDKVTGADLGAPRTARVTIADDDAPPPSANRLPWREDFNLPDGTTATGRWATDVPAGGRFAAEGGRLTLSDTDAVATWTTAPIDVSGAGAAGGSLLLRSVGSLESAGFYRDFVEVAYRVDGGPEVMVARRDGDVAGAQRIDFGGIAGDSVVLIVRGVTTAGSEMYLIDDVRLDAADGPMTPFGFYAQAEDGAGVGGDWSVRAGGSGGRHAVWAGDDSFSQPGPTPISFDFTAPSAGLYSIHLRVSAPSGGDDSVWLKIDGADVGRSTDVSRADGWVKFNGIDAASGFGWDRAHNWDLGGAPVSFYLPAGEHTLRLAPREDGTAIDGVYVTSTDAPPDTALLDAVGGGDDDVTGVFRDVRLVTGGPGKLTDIVPLPGTASTFLISDQDGRVHVMQDGDVRQQPFADLRPWVNGTRDRGLLALAVDPAWPRRPYVYALHTYDPPETANNTALDGPDKNGNRAGRVVRLTADPAALVAQPGEGEVIVGKRSTWANISGPDRDSTGDASVPASGTPDDRGYVNDFIATDSQSHSVGDLQFGVDGALYVSLGDATSYGMTDPRTAYVQDLDTLRGKVLRVDPDTGLGLADNPFYTGDGDDNQSRVYALGLRNPFTMARRPSDGDLFVGDVGWYTREEINVIDVAGGGGENFGWPWYEGTQRTPGYKNLAGADDFYRDGGQGVLTGPAYDRSHADGARAFVAGDFVDADAANFPQRFRDQLLFTDWLSGRIEALIVDADGTSTVETVLTDVGRVSTMARGADGWVYYATHDGRVGRIEFVPAA